MISYVIYSISFYIIYDIKGLYDITISCVISHMISYMLSCMICVLPVFGSCDIVKMT